MEPLQRALTDAFSKLGYEHADLEARLLLVNLDGLATRFYLQKDFNMEALVSFIKSKYKV